MWDFSCVSVIDSFKLKTKHSKQVQKWFKWKTKKVIQCVWYSTPCWRVCAVYSLLSFAADTKDLLPVVMCAKGNFISQRVIVEWIKSSGACVPASLRVRASAKKITKSGYVCSKRRLSLTVALATCNAHTASLCCTSHAHTQHAFRARCSFI